MYFILITSLVQYNVNTCHLMHSPFRCNYIMYVESDYAVAGKAIFILCYTACRPTYIQKTHTLLSLYAKKSYIVTLIRCSCRARISHCAMPSPHFRIEAATLLDMNPSCDVSVITGSATHGGGAATVIDTQTTSLDHPNAFRDYA